MYDRTNEANEFVGDGVDDATGAAARFFGVEAEDLRVVVPDLGEVHGLAGRTVVVAVPKNVKVSPPSGRDRDNDRGGRGGRDRGERGGRGRDRDRDRGGRDRDRGGDRGGDRKEGRGGRDRDRAEAAPAPAAEPVDSTGTKVGEVGAVGEFVLGVVERMGLGSFELSESSEDDFVVVQIRGAASEALSSGDARAVDALQLIAGQAAKRLMDDGGRVVVDVEGDADDREDSLTRLAERAADRALDTGRAVALDAMNPRDRRIVHVALRDQDKIATMSIGSGRYRQVVVVPEGADEYEEARQASQSSS
jgi:predicted RNA-binding protein Jag